MGDMETWKWGDLWVLITSAVGFLFVLVQLVVLHRRELDRRQQRAMFRADMYSPYKGDTAVAMSDNFAILILFPWCQLIGYLGIFFVYGSYLLELGLFADPFPVKFFLELMPMLLIRCSYASIVLFWRQLHMQRRHAVYGSYYRPRFTIMLFLECILLVVWLHVVMDLALFMIETGNHSTFLANFVIFYSFLALSLVVAVWRTRRSLLRDIESFVSRGRSSIGGPGKSFMKVRSISLVIGGALVFSLILAFIQEGLQSFWRWGATSVLCYLVLLL